MQDRRIADADCVPDAAIVEMQILDLDFAAGHMQFNRILGIGHLPRHVDRAHTILHCPDVLENRGDAARDPARDIVQLPGQRNGRRHRSDGYCAGRPLP